MAKTNDNLKEAFAGESQANRMYLAFAEKARQEGYGQVAKYFRAAAESETIHALAHFRTLGAVKDTVKNLEDAIAGETHEFTTMYPEFIEKAQEEGQKSAERSFVYAMKVEQIHEQAFSAAKDAVSGGKDLAAEDLHVCKVCGYVAHDEPPLSCPVCGSPAKAFKRID